MVEGNNVVAVIRDNNGFTTDYIDNSCYKIYKVSEGIIQVRISDHGAGIDSSSWIEGTYKVSIVFAKDCTNKVFFSIFSNTNTDLSAFTDVEKVISQIDDYEPIIEYTYDCSLLNNNDAAKINNAIMSISKHGVFSDPLIGTDKQAICNFIYQSKK